MKSILKAKKVWLFIVTTTLAMLTYGSTVIHDLVPGDGAELALAAYRLGTTHTPGYPLHTFLGKLVNLFVTEPMLATNLLSAICTSLAVGLLSLLILELTDNWLIAGVTAIEFIFLRQVWDMAVATEVYNVNLPFLALAVYFFIRWYKTSEQRYFWGFSIVFGLSLGSFLANILFIPLLVIFIWIKKEHRWKNIFLFGLVAGLIGLVFVAFTYIRGLSLPPIDTNTSNKTAVEALRFFSAADFSPFSIKPVSFYVDRTVEQAKFFSKNYLYLGILFGLWGTLTAIRKKDPVTILTIGLFALNMGFFNYYQGVEFLRQVIPAYFFFSVLLGYGAAALIEKLQRPIVTAVISLMILGLAIGQFTIQIPQRIEKSQDDYYTRLVTESLDMFPDDSLVLTLWERYTLFSYYQTVHQVRPDVTVIDDLSVVETELEKENPRYIFFDQSALSPDQELHWELFFWRWYILVP